MWKKKSSWRKKLWILSIIDEDKIDLYASMLHKNKNFRYILKINLQM